MVTTIKKHLSLKPLIEGFKQTVINIPDKRRTKSVNYPVLDTALSVLACMFYKSGSLLKFQRLMKKKLYKSNLNTQFGVEEIPSDNQIRSILGTIKPEQFSDVFKTYLYRLQRGNHLKKFCFEGKYLVALDGTQYHTSEDISCPECLVKKKSNGKTEYSHTALQAIICHPDRKQILPLMPEPVNHHDGDAKQDCEINAAKRLLPKLRAQHPRMGFIWLADSIYATAPFINMINEHHEEYIFRIKQGDHKHLYEYLETAPYESHKSITGDTTIAYRWYKDVPLNKSSNIKVTVIKAYAITQDKEGKQSSTIVGVWATNLMVNKSNIIKITKAARSRWKVENQCFNALKNSGYELTHNWGHVQGESFNFYVLTMVAFYIHQIFELTDRLFQLCRKVCVTYNDLWEELGALFRLVLFESWEHMLVKCLEDNGVDPPVII
jgi:hypothetical protein